MDAPYQRLAARLRQRIASGEWPPGSRLPSGRELREEYGVGRGVVEYAVAQLRHDGLIETRPGARPEVARQSPAERILIDPRDDWPYARTEPVRGTRQAGPELAGRLQVPDRTRLAWTRWECLGPDGWPAMLETTWRRGAAAPYSDASIAAHVGEFSADEARTLGLFAGLAALRVRRTRYGDDGRPVETADLVLRADRWGISL